MEGEHPTRIANGPDGSSADGLARTPGLLDTVPVIELSPHDVAHGGEAVARKDGKTYFVAGAMPGEAVTAEVVKDTKSWGRAKLVSIDRPSTERVTPRCAHFGTCGGCQWQFADHAAQLVWKRNIVAGQLAHLGGLGDVDVRPTLSPGAPYGYRNRMDFRIHDGKPAQYRAKSRDAVALDECHLLHPNLESLFHRLGPLEGVRKLTIRTGARTGDLMAVINGRVPRQTADWGANVVVPHRHAVDIVHGGRSITEEVAGNRFQITVSAFFQNNTDGAEALVALAREAATLRADDVLLDGYAGGGLFAVSLAAEAGSVIAVEIADHAVEDLEANVAAAPTGNIRVIPGSFEEIAPGIGQPWTVALVDPPRTGLGATGVKAVTTTAPHTVVYVSCDPASLARDSRLLAERGYVMEWAAPVDLFPQTFHVEAVARFVLS